VYLGAQKSIQQQKKSVLSSTNLCFSATFAPNIFLSDNVLPFAETTEMRAGPYVKLLLL
jgi:hypothetical protein